MKEVDSEEESAVPDAKKQCYDDPKKEPLTPNEAAAKIERFFANMIIKKMS